MRIAITGGRDHLPTREEIQGFERIWVVHGGEVLLHGAARGVDSLVAWYVTVWAYQVPRIIRVPVDPSKDGLWPAAGCRRNRRMLEMDVELLVAFVGGTGTAGCMKQARAMGIPVAIIEGSR